MIIALAVTSGGRVSGQGARSGGALVPIWVKEQHTCFDFPSFLF